MKPWLIWLASLILAAGVVPSMCAPAAADQCAVAAVIVRGETSTFQWLARTKARANWRAKVRRLKGLGNPYSDWNRARNAATDCGPNGRGIACTASGIPCGP